MDREYLAKSDGTTLAVHTQDVKDQLKCKISPARQRVIEKYARMTGGENLFVLTRAAIHWHDTGKKDPEWQRACRADFDAQSKWDGPGNAPRGKHLMNAGYRHEFGSVARLLSTEKDPNPVIYAAVAAHHGKLNVYHKGRWEKDGGGRFKDIWHRFIRLSNTIEYSSQFDEAVRKRYVYAGPRAWLRSADQRASSLEAGNDVPCFDKFEYDFPSTWEPRGVQRTIEELWDEPVALLRAPTGSGKTDAALLWAKHQVECDRADRLVIAMPTRFTANALAISNAGKLSSVGLHHSTAWFQASCAGTRLTDQEIETEDNARLLETPITVTTIDHLCMCLTGVREDQFSIFFNLSNACVVIDEADFYDKFTQANIGVLLRALRILEVPVLIMSASLPQSAKELYQVSKIWEDRTESDRVRCHIVRHQNPVTNPEDIRRLLEPALGGVPTIIYANTVRRAQAYFNWLQENGVSPDDLVLYHSKFTEPDKAQIENRLIEMLGKGAWDAGRAKGIAVLTQIGELSVNISADYMISDVCPLDRLVQRVGRLARFPDASNCYHAGTLHVVEPHVTDKTGVTVFYPAPYGTFERGTGWTPSPALTTTLSMLQNGDYSADDFVVLVSELYRELPELDTRARMNKVLLEHLIGSNWLIAGGGTLDEDSDEVGCGANTWKCRDIDPQKTVLVGQSSYGQFESLESEIHLKNRLDFRRLMLESGVRCSTFEFNNADRLGMITRASFTVGDGEKTDSETVFLVNEQCYSSEMGLCFPF